MHIFTSFAHQGIQDLPARRHAESHLRMNMLIDVHARQRLGEEEVILMAYWISNLTHCPDLHNTSQYVRILCANRWIRWADFANQPA